MSAIDVEPFSVLHIRFQFAPAYVQASSGLTLSGPSARHYHLQRNRVDRLLWFDYHGNRQNTQVV